MKIKSKFKRVVNILGVVLLLLLLSCNKKKKTTPIYIDMGYTQLDTYNDENDFLTTSAFFEGGEECIISYREDGGVKIIPVIVNGMKLDMIFDTGCSGTLISIAEANYLYQKGTLTENDFLGISKSRIADGSVVENMVCNLKEVVIANRIICTNVTPTVSKNINAPLLLGNEVLNRSTSFTIDNINKTITFRLK